MTITSAPAPDLPARGTSQPAGFGRLAIMRNDTVTSSTIGTGFRRSPTERTPVTGALTRVGATTLEQWQARAAAR